MAKTKQQKKQEVKELTDKFTEAKATVFASYQGLTVNETEDLRKGLRSEGAELKMAKKRLLKLVLKEQGLDENKINDFSGSLTVAFGYEDEVAPAKIMAKFAKDNEAMQIFGGLLGKVFITTEEIKNLAVLPSRQELLAKTVGTIQAPIAGFVNVLSGNIKNLVYTLNAIKESKN